MKDQPEQLRRTEKTLGNVVLPLMEIKHNKFWFEQRNAIYRVVAVRIWERISMKCWLQMQWLLIHTMQLSRLRREGWRRTCLRMISNQNGDNLLPREFNMASREYTDLRQFQI